MAKRMFFCGVKPPDRIPKSSKALQLSGPQQNVRRDPLAITSTLFREVPDRLLDLMDIASYVFAADRSTSRGGLGGRGMGADWRRDMQFRIAVRDPDHWSSPELVRTLQELLGFMSDDEFCIEFEKLHNPPGVQSYFDFGSDSEGAMSTAPVVLFSGGLDSLAGALEELGSSRGRVVLVTHHSSPIATSFQNDLADALAQRFAGRILYVPVRMTLTGGLQGSETSQRTRTFFYSVLAGAVSSMLGSPGIRFYENGIMSLNLPISPQVVGTAATRSTHPRALREMSLFLDKALSRACCVDNPFFLKTKSEVIEAIAENGYAELIASTISCTNIRPRTKGRSHCGACIQCLHRRFAVLAAGLADHDPADSYALDLFASERTAGRERTMAVEFVNSARQYLRLNDEGFLTSFAGELSWLADISDQIGDDALIRATFDLHQRHGDQITTTLANAIETHKSELSRGTLPPGCLLSCAVGQQDGLKEPPVGAIEAGDTALPAVKAADILLGIDSKRNEILIKGLPPINSPAGAKLLKILADQHHANITEGLAPENHTYVRSACLQVLLGITDATLWQRVDRVRDKICAAFLGHVKKQADRQLIIESRSWQGYRLNPHIRVVAPSEAKEG